MAQPRKPAKAPARKSDANVKTPAKKKPAVARTKAPTASEKRWVEQTLPAFMAAHPEYSDPDSTLSRMLDIVLRQLQAEARLLGKSPLDKRLLAKAHDKIEADIRVSRPASDTPLHDSRNIGRPSVWSDGNIAVAKTLASLGATDLEVAQAFEVSLRTIHRWKIDHPAFRDALEVGKDVADSRVEESLYKRATGYSFDSEKIVVVEGSVERVETIEHVPPDTRAAMWWLQNRRPGIWRDVRHIKHDVEKDSPLGGWLSQLSGKSFAPVDGATAGEARQPEPSPEPADDTTPDRSGWIREG